MIYLILFGVLALITISISFIFIKRFLIVLFNLQKPYNKDDLEQIKTSKEAIHDFYNQVFKPN